MKRLTNRVDGTAVPIEDFCMRFNACDEYHFCEGCPVAQMIDKLCEYEDTGLTPDQIRGNHNDI